MNHAIQFLRRVYAFVLAIIAMLYTATPVAPSPYDYENEYTVKAVISGTAEDSVIFTDSSGRHWKVSSCDKQFDPDNEYILIIYNNNTPEEDDDYVVSVIIYNDINIETE